MCPSLIRSRCSGLGTEFVGAGIFRIGVARMEPSVLANFPSFLQTEHVQKSSNTNMSLVLIDI